MTGLTFTDYVLALPGIALALTIHEYFKAVVSYRLGDPYPKLHGRMRGNLKNHLEPIGFLFMLLYGYGWGLPANTTNTYYKDRKTGTLITYTAPTLINLLFAFAFFMALLAIKQISYSLGLVLPLNSHGFDQGIQTIGALGYSLKDIFTREPLILFITGTLYQIFFIFVRCNLSVAFINLIPIYPLDGAAILENYLTGETKYKYVQYKSILLLILIFLFISGFINALFDPLILSLMRPIQ